MGKTVLRQDKIHGSPAFDDSLTLAQVAALQTNIQGDLDAIRSQLKRILGTAAWTTAAPASLQSLIDSSAVKAKKGVISGSLQAGDKTLDISSVGSLKVPYDQEVDIDVYVNGIMQVYNAADPTLGDYSMQSASVIKFTYTLGATDNVSVIIRNPA